MKKLKTNICILMLLLLVSSCKEEATAEYVFEKEGMTFNVPEDWEITDEEKFDDGSYYLSIDKNGFDSSGVLIITTYNESIDLDELIYYQKEEILSNTIFKNSVFEPIQDDEFNTIDSRATSYTFGLLGLEHEGAIHAFYNQDKTYLVMKQGAIEDKKINNKGFDVIEKSFKSYKKVKSVKR